MNPRAMDFVVYPVTNLERAVPFYRDTLGLKPSGDPFEGKWQEFDLGGVTLALGTPPFAHPSKIGRQEGGASVAIAVEDLDATLEELRRKGVPIVSDPEETPVCFLAAIQDPDGNRITLHQRKDGTAG